MLTASELLGLGQVHEIWHKETPKTYTNFEMEFVTSTITNTITMTMF
jgi:hypothetical protein